MKWSGLLLFVKMNAMSMPAFIVLIPQNCKGIGEIVDADRCY